MHEIRCSYQQPLNLHEMNNGYAVRDQMAGLRNEKEHEVGGRNGGVRGLCWHSTTKQSRLDGYIALTVGPLVKGWSL